MKAGWLQGGGGVHPPLDPVPSLLRDVLEAVERRGLAEVCEVPLDGTRARCPGVPLLRLHGGSRPVQDSNLRVLREHLVLQQAVLFV